MKQYERLKSLPTYGPMYVPVSHEGRPFYSEGFVVKFYLKDGSYWVANFFPGWTGVDLIFDFLEHDRLMVIAYGLVYLMSPSNTKPLAFPHYTLSTVIDSTEYIISTDGHAIIIFNKITGRCLESPRISWDGVKNLKFDGKIISAQTFNAVTELWIDFVMDFKSKTFSGSSYNNGGEWEEFNLW